jgi:hypothetical protein
MSDHLNRPIVSRRALISLALAAAVLFAIAEASYHHTGLLRTVSDVTWVGCVLSLFLLIALGVIAVVQRRRSQSQ